MNEVIITLNMVLNTLEGMSVTGKDNADRYLGSIQGIESAIRMLQATSAPPENHKEGAVDVNG